MEKEWIVGQWYRRLYSDDSFIRYTHTEKFFNYNRIWYNEIIYNGKHRVLSESDYWASNELEWHALNNPVDLSEIQEYLPSHHENKILSTFDISYEEPLIKLLKDIKHV